MARMNSRQQTEAANKIKARELEIGTIIEHDGREVPIERIKIAEAVQVFDMYERTWFGLGLNETVKVLGYFNP